MRFIDDETLYHILLSHACLNVHEAQRVLGDDIPVERLEKILTQTTTKKRSNKKKLLNA